MATATGTSSVSGNTTGSGTPPPASTSSDPFAKLSQIGNNSYSSTYAPSTSDLKAELYNNTEKTAATGNELLSAGSSALQPYLSELAKVFGGDRTAALEASAPEVNTVSEQYDAALRTAQSTAPRGGGRNSTLAQLPQAKSSAIENVLQTARSTAGAQLGQAGLSLSQLGLSAQSGANQSLASLYTAAQAGDSQALSTIAQVGLGIGKLVAAYYTGGASLAVTGK